MGSSVLRSACLLALVLVAALACGCGGSSDGADPTAIVAEPITAQRVEAYAHAVGLRDGDVRGGTVGDPTEELELNAAAKREFEECYGRPTGDVDPLARVVSPTFERDLGEASENFYSSVQAQPTWAETRLGNLVYRSKRAFDCFAPLMAQSLEEGGRDSGGTLEDITVVQLPPLLPDNPSVYGIRAFGTAVSGDLELPVFVDILGFLGDRSEVNLLVTSAFGQPDTREEQRLLRLLFARSRANEL